MRGKHQRHNCNSAHFACLLTARVPNMLNKRSLQGLDFFNSMEKDFVTIHMQNKEIVCTRIKTCFALRSKHQLIPQAAVRLPLLPLVPPLIPMLLVAFTMGTDFHRSMDEDGIGFSKATHSALVHKSDQRTYYSYQYSSSHSNRDSHCNLVDLTLLAPDGKGIRSIGHYPPKSRNPGQKV